MLISIEGTDASGKETQSRKLFEQLKSNNFATKLISFPDYNSESSALVKMYLNGCFGDKPEDVNPKAASIFFASDRYASYRTHWIEEYQKGSIIIADRYTTSNVIHQASKIESKAERQEFIDWLFDLEYNIFGIPKPDLTIFLNMPFEFSKKLMENRMNKISGEEKKDIHESNFEYLKKTNENALEISRILGWIKVDCVDAAFKLKSVEEIQNEIYSIVKKRL